MQASLTTRTTVLAITTEGSNSTGILSYIFNALGPEHSALLILILCGVLGLNLLIVLSLIILLKRKPRQGKAVIDKKQSRKTGPKASTEHYSLDPTEERNGIKDLRGKCDQALESSMSEHDYELPDEDDYENANEIDIATVR